jgi:hypothetical protein
MIRSESDEKNILLSLAQQEIHHSSTGFPHAFASKCSKATACGHAWETLLRSSALCLTDYVRLVTLNAIHAR